jgi:hypothetical protein
MATVGGSVVHGQGGITLGAPAVFVGDGLLGDSLQAPPLARATSQPANPTGTSSTSAAAMMGLAGSITPKLSGNVQITVTGTVFNSNATVGDGSNVQISYGTGSAPANAGVLQGTQIGSNVHFVSSTAAGKVPFCLMAYVTGLVPNTAYWIDLAVQAVTGGPATVQDITIVAVEI